MARTARRAGPDIADLARILDDAARTGIPIPQLAASETLSLDDAYKLQAAVVGRRLDRGDERSGAKMGLTSRAKAAQMGVDEPIYARLTRGMLIDDGGSLPLAAYVRPKVECEIAFLLKAPLAGRVSPAQAMTAVEAIAPAIEMIDSRYRDFKFSLTDVVADNASAAGYAIGPWHRPDCDLGNLGMVLEFDGRPVQIGSSAAILGHPLRSLAMAARLAAETGDRLEPGFVILAGSATAAEALRPGVSVRLAVEQLGCVGFRVTGQAAQQQQ